MHYESNNYLQHHGVKDMKWGVQRYQKSNGGLTLRGKRLSKKYKKYSSKYGTELAKNQTKLSIKAHNRVADKKADQGKILYTKGYRIRDNVGTKLVKVGSTAAAVTGMAYANGFIDKNKAIMLGSLSSTAIASGAAIKFVNSNKNKKLRAYYAHTSKY